MKQLLLVAIGGGLGQHFDTAPISSRCDGSALISLGAIGVNVIGSFAMGLFIELLTAAMAVRTGFWLFVATGILGGFTTFSAFSLDFLILTERGALGSALLYALGSVVLSITALFLGLWLVRTLAG